MADLEQIKKLRDLTGAGMMDCQKALTEANDDMDKAVEVLRKKGEKMAGKKADRVANEGVIAIVGDNKKLAIVGLNCETDFVARNEDFIQSVNEFAEKLLEIGKEEFESWAEAKIKDELIVKIGENLKLAFFDIIEAEVIGYYLHSNKKVATTVSLSKGNAEVAKEIAMHATAMNPQYLKPEDVPADVLEKEKEIYQEQLAKEGKPADIIEKILEGKVNKFYQEVCLVKQAFVKDDKKSIEKLLEENEAVIEKFNRYVL
jgi:elongation factor Ts